MDAAIGGIYGQILKSQYAKNSKVQNQQFAGILDTKGTEDTNGMADTQKTSLYQFSVYEKGKFSVYKSEDYSEENPIMYIRGTDENGNHFEQSIDPREVDPEDATFIEFSVFSAWLSEGGRYDSFMKNYNFADLKHIVENISEKKDYLDTLRNWRDDQADIGNMAGYHNVVRLCSVITTYMLGQSGDIELMETENGKNKAYRIDMGIGNTGYLGNGGFPGVGFQAYYAYDSTAENPIVEVTLHADAWPEGKEEKRSIGL